jgi:hypothetical protein
MNRTLRTMLLLAALTGAAGCKDSNSTITFDATATASDGKGDGGAATDGGKSDGSALADSGPAPDGGGTSIDADASIPIDDGGAASDTGSADAEQGQ